MLILITFSTLMGASSLAFSAYPPPSMHTHKSWQDWSILVAQNSSDRNGASDDKQSISNPIVSGNGKEELIPKFIQILFYDKYHKQTSTIWSIQHRLMSIEWLWALWGIFPLSTRSSSMVGACNYNKSSNRELIQFQLYLCSHTHTHTQIHSFWDDHNAGICKQWKSDQLDDDDTLFHAARFLKSEWDEQVLSWVFIRGTRIFWLYFNR